MHCHRLSSANCHMYCHINITVKYATTVSGIDTVIIMHAVTETVIPITVTSTVTDNITVKYAATVPVIDTVILMHAATKSVIY